jgi:hypothetical protein
MGQRAPRRERRDAALLVPLVGWERTGSTPCHGPSIRVRFFGGWSYDADLVRQRDWLKQAYAAGVPMGADLPAPGDTAPTFAVWAVKDPDAGNLDRIQIVKGWARNGQSFEKIHNVVRASSSSWARP